MNRRYLFEKSYLFRTFKQLTQKIIKRSGNTLIFLRALIKNPRVTGAILPSSNQLAREMVSHVNSEDGWVVELGAGTGVFTDELIKSGIAPSRIIAVEYSALLARKLQQRFPDVQVIQGNASELIFLLGEKASNVKTVISGIPLRSLPKSMAQAILHQISMLLPVDGRYIQFTYQFKQNLFFSPTCFKEKFSKIIWKNMPLARVDVFVI